MPDYVGQIYTHLADVMTAADGATKAAVRRFTRFDTANGNPLVIKGGAPNDAPNLIFELAEMTDTGKAEPVTFVACNRVRTRIATFTAKLIVDDERLLQMTAAVEAVYADLVSAIDPLAADKQDLGIAGCNSVILATRFRTRRTKTDEDAPDRWRRVGLLQIPVRITSRT